MCCSPLAVDNTAFQVNNRLAFKEFVGLRVMNDISDVTTFAFLEKGFVRLV